MDDKAFQLIQSKAAKLRIETRLDKRFSQLTTFGTGGAIKLTLYPDSIRKLIKVVRLLDRLNVSYCILGKGSNVLASDADYDGVVVVTTKLSKVSVKGNYAYALSGTSTITLARKLQEHGLTGGEFLACLPATVGGAVVGNAGCYGQDVQKILYGVEILHNNRRKWLKNSKCELSKRNSLFKQGGYVVLAAKFKLAPSTSTKVQERTEQMRRAKAASQPLNYRSAGSVFYHEQVAVSRLIDEAGLKGYRVGGAEVSSKHAGFVINVDKATSLDIYLVIQHIATTLWERYGVRAKLEIRLVNFDEQPIEK